jgi:hypothetical protein
LTGPVNISGGYGYGLNNRWQQDEKKRGGEKPENFMAHDRKFKKKGCKSIKGISVIINKNADLWKAFCNFFGRTDES